MEYTQRLTPEEALPRIRAVLARGDSCRVVVTGNSMRPLLHDKKDAVILSRVVFPVHKRDILFYVRPGGACILHQVYRLGRDGTLVMCGAAQMAPEPISPDAVVGRVTSVERGGKTIPVTSPGWRFMTLLWALLRPIRPLLFAIRRRMKKV